MSQSLHRAHRSPLVPDRETVGQGQAKATLRPRVAVEIPTETFPHGEAIWEVLVKGHGSVKATAITMGNRDRSLLRREVLDGTLTLAQLLSADDRALTLFGEFLIENFGQSRKSKQQIARERLPELLALMFDALAVNPEEK